MSTCELITFPNTDEADESRNFYVMNEDGEEICLMINLNNARNVARLLAKDWPGRVYSVEDDKESVLFTTGSEA
jgi:hypothetical protein